MSELIKSKRVTDNPVLLKSKYGKALHCLLLPLQDDKLLLPNTAVAEVITYINPESIDNAPDWLMGTITWRDIRIPLVSFELLSGLAVTSGGTRRIAVLNTLNGNQHIPYIAILIQGIPQLRLIQEDSIQDEDIENDKLTIASVVKVNGEQVLIPDLDDLESRLKQIL